ncbi:MAG: hypothetical protein RBR08_15130 [Desulforegulaceae bacterium]|nr:hypothetical protein [Desulforegulaceae bacterium]
MNDEKMWQQAAKKTNGSAVQIMLLERIAKQRSIQAETGQRHCLCCLLPECKIK